MKEEPRVAHLAICTRLALCLLVRLFLSLPPLFPHIVTLFSVAMLLLIARAATIVASSIQLSL
jgi:hypothetical protein